MTSPNQIAVCVDPVDDGRLNERAAALAEQLHLPLAKPADPTGTEMLLTLTLQRLELRVIGGQVSLRGGRPVYADFARLDTRSGAGARFSQPLAKAVGLKKGDSHRPAVIDATAGLGEDAWLLAALGCHVTAIERHPAVAALLADALHRVAIAQPDIAARVDLQPGDALALLPGLERPDVVYLDPMFPPGRKTLERKPLRVLRRLVGDDQDAAALLATALQSARRRVVVKRPARAEPLTGRQPTIVHPGKGFRFDVYALPANAK